MDKAKKKRIKNYLTWAGIAALVLLLTVMPLLARSEAEADGPVASVLSATVEKGSIQTALHGGGTLEADGVEDVNIPTGVKITEFLVKNGDSVEKGDPVALVDKVSVMTAITGVTETMEYLQEELEDARDEKIDSTIRATAGGRIKKVFAQKGESVQEVMLRDGALAVLSIDGLMAVKIENTVPVTTGESVLVRIPDLTAEGNVVVGRVDSNLNGVKIITIEDDGFEIGTEVTVSKENGEAIGSGSLYVHNAWKATAFSGTISTVYAKEETKASIGSSLFALTDTDYTGEMERRANQHREYEELLQRLIQMYNNGTIDAPCEGVISGVDEDSAHLLAAGEEDWEVMPLENSSNNGGYRIIFLSNEMPLADPNGCDGTAVCTASVHNTANHACMNLSAGGCPAPAGNHKSSCLGSCTHASDPHDCPADPNHYKDCIKSCNKQEDCDAGKHYKDCLSLCISSDGSKSCPGAAHKTTCIEQCSRADDPANCSANPYHYGDCIKTCNKEKTCTASKHYADCYHAGMTYTAYIAKVYKVGNTELIVYQDGGDVYSIARKDGKWVLTSGAFDEKLLVNQYTRPVSNAGDFKEGDLVLFITGKNANGEIWTSTSLYQRAAAAGGMSGMPNIDLGALLGGFDLSAMMGGFGGYGSFGSTTTLPTEDLYDLDGSTLLTVTPQKTMTLAITLDEHDIAKVNVGDEAIVKIEAMRNQTFPATVSKVGTSGTNNSGSSKFPVELSMEADSAMLSGFSSTAQIPLKNYENILILPVAALVEEGTKTCVCTALNKETGAPISPVEVEIGASDGEYAEILSGLQEGDTVYYSYYDVLELDTSAVADKYSIG